VIDATHDLALQAPFDRLIVAGTPKATSQLIRLLPKRLRGKLVETVGMSVGASKKEVLKKILAVQRKMEREQESVLVEGVLAELHDGGKAVAGFASVLDAVNQGRVWKLFYAKGLKKVGGECSDCGAYTPDATGPCVYCGGGVQRRPQCVDRLSQSVMEMGGQVEVVDGPAKEALAANDGIAALLRY
jgi:peptide subunit release factor 1 (eRF1)